MALAVAWAAYLIPKALQHHEEVVRSRSVDRFSHRMRVLARREPVNGRNARLVVTPGPRRGSAGGDHQGLRRSAPTRARREAVARATRRRRRVLGVLVLITAAVVGVAAFSLISWWYVALPVGALVAWLVACRLMVRGERGPLPQPRRRRGRGRARRRGRPREAGDSSARGHHGQRPRSSTSRSTPRPGTRCR